MFYVKSFCIFVFSLIFSLGEMNAYQDGFQDCCCSDGYNWTSWVGGAVLGAAAGAAAGYAAGNRKGKKGRRGPTGPTGPAADGIGFTENITDSLEVTLDASTITDVSVVFTIQVINPLGVIVGSASGVNFLSGIVPLVNLAAATPKIEGTYLLRWDITTPSGMIGLTNLGDVSVVINMGAPDLIATAERASWVLDQIYLSSFTFP